MRALFSLLFLSLGFAGKPVPFEFEAINQHFTAHFGDTQPEAINAEIAKLFKEAAGFGTGRMWQLPPKEMFEIAGQRYRVRSMELIGDRGSQDTPSLQYCAGPNQREHQVSRVSPTGGI